MASSRVLVVEDEAKLLKHLINICTDEGFSTFSCASYSEFELLINLPITRFEVLLLDRLLNGHDSADLIPKIKKMFPDIKILIVSAIDTAVEKASLLDLGADDYLAKPFDSNELIARIRALLRRNRRDLKIGNLHLNPEKRTATIDGKDVPLQNKEYALLHTIVQSPGKVYHKLYLYEHVWEMSTEVESNVVEATVNKLRRRLEEYGANFSIKSMRNKGYWVEE